MDLTKSLNYLRPGEAWTLNGDGYDGLTWLADTEKPTEQELIDAYPLAVQAAADKGAAEKAARESAIAKLASLGLSEVEVAALLGGQS